MPKEHLTIKTSCLQWKQNKKAVKAATKQYERNKGILICRNINTTSNRFGPHNHDRSLPYGLLISELLVVRNEIPQWEKTQQAIEFPNVFLDEVNNK